MDAIPMVDLKNQYLHIQPEIDNAIGQCLLRADYIQGESVRDFESRLSDYTGFRQVIGCGNGTDAIQLALMAANLPKGSKVIVPAFTYIAPAEVVAFLGYEPVFADVDAKDFNITLQSIQAAFTADVKAIIMVHLFGQLCKDTEVIYDFCLDKNILLIEDNAQSLGVEKNIFRNSITTTSFFPTKNLGAFGDGGAVLCNDETLAETIRKIASHGQSQKYIHDMVGINSRLDTMQAAILGVKLKHLDAYNQQRRQHASFYHKRLKSLEAIELPELSDNHIFHQFTIKVKDGKRDRLAGYLSDKKIASVVNYPLPVYQQGAYKQDLNLPNAERLCASSLSIPVYPEISETQLSYICDCIEEFCKTI